MNSENGCRDALKTLGGGGSGAGHCVPAVTAGKLSRLEWAEVELEAMKRLLDERDHLRKQVTELQSRGTELLLENRKLRADQFVPFDPADYVGDDDVKWTGDGKEPKRGSELASGVDLCSMTRYLLEPGERTLISTGIRVEMPAGWEAQVRPRSSFSKKGIYTALGTIDADYRGDIGVILENRTGEDFVIEAGHRIAQLVFAPVFRPTMVRVRKLSETERGTSGWGSTGR